MLSQYVITDRHGRPGKGNDKGKVEGHVGYRASTAGQRARNCSRCSDQAGENACRISQSDVRPTGCLPCRTLRITTGCGHSLDADVGAVLELVSEVIGMKVVGG